MAKSYQDAIKTILAHEGGFVNHPLDKGGATNWGITQKTYEAYKGRKVSVDEIKNMPVSEAISIYKKNYWDAVGANQLKYYATALALFDQAVNKGPQTVLKQAQSVLGIPQSGRPDVPTIKALNAVKDTVFLPKFLDLSENHYKAIVNKNPSQSVFIAGWLKRIQSLRSKTLAFAGVPNAVGLGLVALISIGALGFTAFRYFARKPSTKSNPYSKRELKMGIAQESKEHGVSKKRARKIAKDHLRENKKYYSKLRKAGL